MSQAPHPDATTEADGADPSPTPDAPDDAGSGQSIRPILIAVAVIVALGVAAAAFNALAGSDDTTASESAGADGGDAGEAAAGLDRFPFTTEDGEIGVLSDFQGAPTVINFYASWCAPCRAELPEFRDVQAQAGDRVRFLGVSHDIDETSWRSLNDEFELNYPTVFQREAQIHAELELLGMPATAFMNEDGEIVHTFTGVLNEEALKDLIAEHLGVEV
ncbi:MAG: TlpA disulfide reductase family protein [Actinomycetota bacterium]